MRISENVFISSPDDVRQMLNLDHETVLRMRKAGCTGPGKCVKEMVGQTQDIAYQTWIHKLRSRSMCICPSKKGEKSMECLVCMLSMWSEVEMRLSTESWQQCAKSLTLESGTLAISESRVVRFRRCQMEKLSATWNSTSMSLNKLKCPRLTKPSLSVSWTQRSILNSEEVLAVWTDLWITAVIISVCRTASKTSLTDSSRFAETQ